MRDGALLFSAVGSLLVLFLMVPLVLSLVAGAPTLPSVLHDREALNAVYLSFNAGVVASLIVAALGTPLGYLFSRRRGFIAKVTESFLELPLAIPHSVAGIMVLLAYNSRAPIGSLLSRLGVVIEDHYWGIVFVMAFVSSPIYITAVRAGFDSIDVELENVARTLGASFTKTFYTVTLPLALRHIAAGFILSLARAISEVGAVMVVAYYPKVAATLVVERYLGYGLQAALSLSAFLLLLSLAIFVALRFLVKEG